MYREKDIAEKAFKAIKNDIQLRPLNVKTTMTLQGLLFACFIALTVRMRLLRIMKEKGLLKKYTLESLFLELEKLKKIELENGELITTEQTKKQREILQTLGLTP
jgi:transposase